MRSLLANLSLDDTFDPAFWKKLTFFALVQPAGDILPVRTKYNGETSNIGINPLNSDAPIWYAGPDLIAAKLWVDQPPEIIRAIRIIPEGQQIGLEKVALRGMVEIDPRTDDFFKVVIEARERVKAEPYVRNRTEQSAIFPQDSGELWVLWPLCRTQPRTRRNRPQNRRIRQGQARGIFRGTQFETTSTIVEKPGSGIVPYLHRSSQRVGV